MGGSGAVTCVGVWAFESHDMVSFIIVSEFS